MSALMSLLGADFTTLGLSPGRWVKIRNGDNAGHSLATAADNGFCRIAAVTTHQLSFEVPAGFLVNGATIYSNTIER